MKRKNLDVIDNIKKQRVDDEYNKLCNILENDILNKNNVEYIIVNNKQIKLNITNKYYDHTILNYDFLIEITNNIISSNDLDFTLTNYDNGIENVIWSTICNTLLNKKILATLPMLYHNKYKFLNDNITFISTSELHRLRNMMLLTITNIFHEFINQYKYNLNILDINFNICNFIKYSEEFNIVLDKCKEYLDNVVNTFHINTLSKLNKDDLIQTITKFKNHFVNNTNLKNDLQYLFENLNEYKICENDIIIQDYIGIVFV